MQSLNNILIKEIFSNLKPNQLFYNNGDCHTFNNQYVSSLRYSILNIALVSWKWFTSLSSLINHLEIRFSIDDTCEVEIYNMSRNYNRFKDQKTLELKQFSRTLCSKFSLLRASNISNLIIRDVYPWSKSFEPVLKTLYAGEQLKKVTVQAEIVLLQSFITKHPHKNRFQYCVVPTITNDLVYRDVLASIKYLSRPSNNIDWLETIYECTYETPMSTSIEILKEMEKLQPNTPTNYSISSSSMQSNDGSINVGRLNSIYKLELNRFHPLAIAEIIGGMPSLKILKISVTMCQQEGNKQYIEESKIFFDRLKANETIESFAIKEISGYKRSNQRPGIESFANQFGDLLAVNRSITKLKLDHFFHFNTMFFESLSTTNTLKRLQLTLFDHVMCDKLFAALQENNSIEDLCLSSVYNGLNEDLIERPLAKLIESNHNLNKVKARYIKMTGTYLLKSLKMDSNTLKHLFVCNDTGL
ncbi:hypothetical protein PPL_12088 [Heterostelium album PN500]|uniref:Uncharacterized protein n=1 Tax=Heterostelium pallidum (strain ATCC 26659 / Pp 5 / PN500) TaxID=670386 RepID=D3BLN5_HETP5|nr:hypothetical protein PPL_12088 [Heterostelium album PN500]EFA77486.1 hypothetical protein PPL_12088 [Heterostelium album PN500]|eukprot:XP_020429614.1 hypothetical protein PPL_12088 [Heterostelium album PN500]